jgi:hypothetical protein
MNYAEYTEARMIEILKQRAIALGVAFGLALGGYSTARRLKPEWFANAEQRAFNEHFQVVDRPMVETLIGNFNLQGLDTSKVKRACLKRFMTEEDGELCIVSLLEMQEAVEEQQQ